MALLNIVFPTCTSQTSQLTSLRTRDPFVVPTKLLGVSLSRNNKAPSIKCRTDAGTTGDKLSIAHDPSHIKRHNFPNDFIFGTSSAAYQVEGAANEGGKGPSIWDTFTHHHPEKIDDWSNGDRAVDSYNRYSEDIKIMKDAGIDAYRFSISWSRILPEGSLAGGRNQEGIDYYHRLIDEVIAQGMKPFVTLFHWDLPQGLEDKYGGFRNAQITDDFKDYCEICFYEFGPKVKHWTTLNEPYMFSTKGYDSGEFAPGRCSPSQGTCEAGDSAIEPYIVTHNLLLAHGKAVRLYKEYFQAEQKGEIGITLNCQWSIPLNSDNFDDQAAAFRYLDFCFGWFMDPLVNGDYPFIMKAMVRDRLPIFKKEESEMIKGSYDFIGLNYYTTRYAYSRTILPNEVPISCVLDSYVESSEKKDGVPIGPLAPGSRWVYSYPQGLKELLIYTKKKYNNPIIYITENGKLNYRIERDVLVCQMSRKREFACSPSRLHHFISSLSTSEKQAITSTSFGPLVEIADVRISSSLICLLIEKYDSVNEWFVIRGKRIRFHIYEMALITGLDVVEKRSKFHKKVDEKEVKLFRAKYFGKKEEISRGEIEHILEGINSDENIEDFRRVSLLYFLSCFLIPNKEQTLSIEYTYKVYDIANFNCTVWGKIVYDELLKGLKDSSMKFKQYKKHSHLNGCAYALQVWALERIPILAPSPLVMMFPRYKRYCSYVPLKREAYECLLKSANPTMETKVTLQESRILIIRDALNARGLEGNTTKLVERITSLEKGLRLLKKEVCDLKSKKRNPSVPESNGEGVRMRSPEKDQKHSKKKNPSVSQSNGEGVCRRSPEIVRKASWINSSPPSDGLRQQGNEHAKKSPTGYSMRFSFEFGTMQFGESSREENARVPKRAEKDFIVIDTDGEEILRDNSTNATVVESRNYIAEDMKDKLYKSFHEIGKRAPKKSCWLRSPFQAYENRSITKYKMNAHERHP